MKKRMDKGQRVGYNKSSKTAWERGKQKMKQKFLHVLIMVLAVAAVVGGVALFSDWVAPLEETAPLATAVATSPVQNEPMDVNEPVADGADAAPVEVTVVDPAEIKDLIERSGGEDVTVTMYVFETDPETGRPVFTVVDDVPDIQLADLMGGEEATEDTIFGRWQMTPECVAELYGFGDVICVMELTEDGTFTNTLTVMDYNETHTATYTVEGNTIIVDGTAAEYLLDGDRLTIKAGGVEQTFARVK